MSYILEALKKAEQKRQQETVPTLLTIPYAPETKAKKSRPWRTYFPLAVLLLNAAFLLWWLHPWQQPHPPRNAPPALPQQEPVRQPASLPPAPPAQTVRDSSALLPEGQQGREEKVSPGKAREEEPVGEKAAGPPHAAEKKVLPFGELPPAVQQSLPALQIAGHFYSSSPSSRIVSINGHTVREGQEAAEGVTVERITPDGVILSFQGYRFHRGVF